MDSMHSIMTMHPRWEMIDAMHRVRNLSFIFATYYNGNIFLGYEIFRNALQYVVLSLGSVSSTLGCADVDRSYV